MIAFMYSQLSRGMHIHNVHIAMMVVVFHMLWSFFIPAQAQAQAQAQAISSASQNPNMISTAKDWLRSVDFRVNGFVSQAFITTSDNDVFGNSDKGGSFGFTEAGLTGSLRPISRLQLSAQVLSRRAGKGNSGKPRLDFAFADYRLYSHETRQFGIRVGRLKNPFGFYNDTRDVAFTRPSILLPQSIYFDRVRNIALSGEAVQFYGETSVADIGNFSAQFGVFRPIVGDTDTKASLVGLAAPGDLAPEASYIGRGVFESSDQRFRLALSGIWLNIDYDPGKDDKLGAGKIQFSPIYLSAQYNTERWSLTSEYALRYFKFKNFNNPVFDEFIGEFIGESFYFQGAYRFHPKWEAVVRYDVLFTDRKDRKGKKFAASPFARGAPAYSRFAKDITVGLRWSVSPEFMLRAEYHRVDGTAWLSPLDNPVRTDASRHWYLFAFQASYRF